MSNTFLYVVYLMFSLTCLLTTKEMVHGSVHRLMEKPGLWPLFEKKVTSNPKD